jgi:hypothetical protein
MTIPGSYWDSQIYSGRLYLFGCEGDIRTLNWDRLISEWMVDDDLRVSFDCAFSRSDFFYGDKWTVFFKDREVKALIESKFGRLQDVDLTVSNRHLNRVTIRQQENPFPFPHADCTIYKKNMYVVSTSGVFESRCDKKNKNPVSVKASKTWDCPTLSVSASYNTLALAGGDEGLFELSIANGRYSNTADRSVQLGKHNCTDCEWAFYSIYGSSHVDRGYLAAFIKERDDDHFERRLEALISEQNIFKTNGYSWGNRDRICQANGASVRIVKYEPWHEEREDQLTDLGSIRLSTWKGGVVSGTIAVFGIIIECDNAVVVVPSTGDVVTIKGEPVNWRVFPRSKQYENQLHILYDDRLEIISFNHDYFVDQETKRLGTKYYGNR